MNTHTSYYSARNIAQILKPHAPPAMLLINACVISAGLHHVLLFRHVTMETKEKGKTVQV